MRWIVFQTSLGRLDKSALAINILFLLLISFLMLLRKDLSHKASLWEGVCDFLPGSLQTVQSRSIEGADLLLFF